MQCNSKYFIYLSGPHAECENNVGCWLKTKRHLCGLYHQDKPQKWIRQLCNLLRLTLETRLYNPLWIVKMDLIHFGLLLTALAVFQGKTVS